MRRGITPEQAREEILAETPVLRAESVTLTEALGRVLAEPIDSARLRPPADNSAMDGYAVRRADCAGAGPGAPIVLPIAFEVPAGAADIPRLEAGHAARILTGAALPPGADSVVRQEDSERRDGHIALLRCPDAGEHVRRAGEDVGIGERVLEPGTRLGAPQLGMLASLGRTIVAVHQRARVAILSGGDELVEPDRDASGGRIVSSNSYSIAAQCREIGAQPVYLGIARDTPEDLEQRFRAGLGADVLVSSAGVSVGDRDFVRDVLEKLGCELRFWGVEMKPGYPLAFGRIDAEREADRRGPLVFGLPGNPVSAMMTFEQFVRPALLRMNGARRLHRPLVRVRLGEAMHKKPGRLHFVRVALERDGDEIVAHSTGNQSSGVLKSMIRAHGVLLFDADASDWPAGRQAWAQVIDEDFLASDTPGY